MPSGSVFFSAALKQYYENVQQVLDTNNVVITQTQSTTNPGTADAGSPPDASANPEWTSDISTAVFPDHPVSGKVHGLDFVMKTALFRNGNLKLSSADGMVLEIFRLKPPVDAQSYEVQATDDNAKLHVRMTWNENGTVQTATFSQGYGLKLQFDQAANRKIPAKIYLCFPDDSKSCVAGTFDLKAPKSK